MKSTSKNLGWTLSYGWSYRRPDSISANEKPAHLETIAFHSLEAALHHPELGTWQEIRDPAGVVVMVTGRGFDETYPNVSLCAKQILNTRYPGMFPEAVMDNVLDTGDLVSHDDGKTWSRVLLGAKSSSRGNGKPHSLSASRLDNLRISAGPEDGKIEIRYGGEARIGILDSLNRDDIQLYTIYSPPPKRKPVGRAVVLKSVLAIKQNRAKSDKQPPSYDLVIRKPDEKRARVYAENIDQSVVEAGRRLGIAIKEPEAARADGLPRAWKPGLFKIEWKEEGESDTTKEVRGFIRGSLAIDRRLIDQEGYNGVKWQTLRWCLTHIPTGTGIVNCKTRKDVEEIADALREVVPELTDGDAPVTEEIKVKGREVLERFGIKVKRKLPDKVDQQDQERAKMFAVPIEVGLDRDPVHTAVNGPVIDPERRFYVSVVNGSISGYGKTQYGFLVGPFKLHQTALSLVDEVSRLVQDRYPWSHFYAFGTCSLPKESAFKIPGVLNDEDGFQEIYRRAFVGENQV